MINVNILLGLTIIIGFLILQNGCEYRIVGGELATSREQFPYIVSFRRLSRNNHFCGGTIIHEKAVLSASHCFRSVTTDEYNIFLVAGDLNIAYFTNDSNTHYIVRIVHHEGYDSVTYNNDVAITFIERKFSWTPLISPLPLSNVIPTAGSNCTVSGWGTMMGGTSTLSSNLLYAVVPIVGTEECSINYGEGRITDAMVCAGFMETGGLDACNGDSGGPLVFEGALVGVVSWGNSCALDGYPGVYSNVAYLNNWVDFNLQKYIDQNEDLTSSTSPTVDNVTTTATPDNNSGASRSFSKLLYLCYFIYLNLYF